MEPLLASACVEEPLRRDKPGALLRVHPDGHQEEREQNFLGLRDRLPTPRGNCKQSGVRWGQAVPTPIRGGDSLSPQHWKLRRVRKVNAIWRFQTAAGGEGGSGPGLYKDVTPTALRKRGDF